MVPLPGKSFQRNCVPFWEKLVNMSHVTRKPVFRVCDQVRNKPTCSATVTSYRLEISDIKTRGIILSRQRTTKMLRGFVRIWQKQVLSWGGSYFNCIYSSYLSLKLISELWTWFLKNQVENGKEESWKLNSCKIDNLDHILWMLYHGKF